MTEIPVKISRVTRFSLSIRTWSFLNRGIARVNRASSSTETAPALTAIIRAIEVLVRSAIIIPPAASSGEYMTIRKSIVIMT